MKKLPFHMHAKLFFKSFFVQALWNYRSMLALGLAYILSSLCRSKKLNKSVIAAFYESNSKFFNSHPYFTGYFLGFVARLWNEQPDDALEKIDKMRNYIIGPLGAIGDELFWHDIKPSTMILAVLGGLLQYYGYPGWICMAAAFIMYNIPHFYIRWHGITAGYEAGITVYSKLHFDSFKKIFKLYQHIGALSWLMGVGIVVILAFNDLSVTQILIILAGLAFAKLLEYFYKKNIEVILALLIFTWTMLIILEG